MSSEDRDQTSPLLSLPNTYRAFYGSFTHLYPIQQQIIDPLLQGKDLILQSATGSGKTEAVLAPCLERVIQAGRERSVLYVVPTRALAVDLERRLAPIVERLGLRMGLRTGDIKRPGGARPDLLLTTPESLDVALGSANADTRGFVQRIGAVIIDEVHPLIYSYRGRQLAYLLRRVACRTAGPLQKIALSATIAEVDAVVQFFDFRADAVQLVESVQRQIEPHFVQLKNDESELSALVDDLYETWNYRKILLFANSRSHCDRLFSLLQHHGHFAGVSELHYSNLKARERRGVEQRFRRREHALCVATSTLELGIDIGDVDGVLLYEPPDSAAAFLQRIGRSNRRQGRMHFWGICRGERAAEQLLYFLGLLHLARQGQVEAPQPKDLPSVLVQQVLSCLYEKKRISLAALQNLFVDQGEVVAALFAAMLKQGWLRQDRVEGLFRGGWRYRDCFLERQIWSNFPAAEEEYTLSLAGEAIADLPKSVVGQLELGDRVHLAGKRLQVVQIESGERKQVLARPVEQLDDKEIFWLGSGLRVSYEVAQSVRAVLGAESAAETLALFARTRKLLEVARDSSKRTVMLDNGMEVGRGVGGCYQYRTYLGSVGNLVLQWSIESEFGPRLEDLAVKSDGLGVECSHWINFQDLHLPSDRAAFGKWVARHLDGLCNLLPLNAFASALPRPLLVEEVTDFLFDRRIAEAFLRYRQQSAQIVAGDPALLELELAAEARHLPVWLDTVPGVESLLEWEKRRWGERNFAAAAEVQRALRSLTGTMVGSYFRHQQCERFLSLHFIPSDQRAADWRQDETGALRLQRGKEYERWVLDYIRARGETLRVVEAVDISGRDRALSARFTESLAQLQDAVKEVEATGRTLVLSQGVLILSALLGPEDAWLAQVDGVGIPDLIRVVPGKHGPLLEVGDIKDSRAPQDSQQWQVAFYALLLRELIRRQVLPLKAEVAPTAFLMLRPAAGAAVPELYRFELQPYLAAFPMLWRQVGSVLQRAPDAASYRLQSHCSSCANFAACYSEALHQEDVLFLPQLSAGGLQKFRQLGIETIDAAAAFFACEEPVRDDPFSPHQRERLTACLAALREQRIGLRERQTRLFPHNISTAIFVQLLEDPISGLPRCIGWRILRGGKVDEERVWIIASEEELAGVWASFAERFLALWQQGIESGQGPHVFHFGSRCWHALQAWGEGSELAFLWEPGRTHRTDLRPLLAAHFDLPVPMPTLFALGRLLGLQPKMEEPESLFHLDDPVGISPAEWMRSEERREETAQRLDAMLRLQVGIWQWACSHLESVWEQSRWHMSADETYAVERSFVDFLQEQQRLREEDILVLQDYALAERVARFRSVGPLSFAETALDEEGRFLYGFQTLPEVGLSKFREGDFLKLAPVGTADLQSGFSVILATYDRAHARLWVHSRQGRLALDRQLTYSLEEDLSDWNGPKLMHAVRSVFSAHHPHALAKLFAGGWAYAQSPEERDWVQNWLRRLGSVAGLNPMQQQALSLPFCHRLSMIEGPPGTGKTHLLAWTLIALMQRAQEEGKPLRIAVSALTHQAIDQVLKKVVALVGQHRLQDFPGRCLKWGRWQGDGPVNEGDLCVEALDDVQVLKEEPYFILGATGFGLYQIFEGRKGVFPQVFDWVVFDETSQLLIPQALLSLLYGKGNFLFVGDVKQLPPIVLGNRQDDPESAAGAQHSVLAHLLNGYGPEHRVRLDQTYRMSEELCFFPSRTWYDGELRSAVGNAGQRLVLDEWEKDHLLDRIIDPEKPVVLLIADHQGCHQQADLEVEIMSELACHLMKKHGLTADRLALISPHRAQNNATAERLESLLGANGETLPLIDTVERVQGAERDVILFAFTTSDADFVVSEFLNNPQRFNVAITRARQKLIVVGSRAFFAAIPTSEQALKNNSCFKEFYEFCRERDSLFFWE